MSSRFGKEICVLLPVYNESKVLKDTIEGLKQYFDSIIAVNDCSSDDSENILTSLDVLCINHPINLGQGAAIDTGFKFIQKKGEAKAVITFDADGQHRPIDAYNLAREIITCDEEIIFGSRFLTSETKIPFFKERILRLAIFMTKRFLDLQITDTHNGLKAYKIDAIKKIRIDNYRYAFESEILFEVAKKNISYKEFPVQISYTPYSKSKGQSIFNALVIFEDIIFMIFNRK